MLYCPNQKEEDLLYACKQHLTGEALKDAFVFTYDRMRRYGGAWHLDTIVNFHNALLPKFPGRNAPSWAIFENEQETGITWHYVTKQVDAGDIIIQKKCRITADVRAYELTEKLMQLAFEAFKEKFAEIIEDRAAARKQLLTGKRKIYKSSDIPGMCRFGMEDSPEYIYRLLRAEEKPGRLYLPLDGEFSLRLSWAEVCGNFEGGGVMPDIEYFYELVSWVRTADRKYLSNYYFLQNTLLSKAIEQAEITYHYREKEYLVLWYQKEQFKRMYYFIADAGHYKISNDSDEIYVCDIICRDPDSSEAGRILSRAGMRKHAVYMKWLCRSPVYLNMQSPSDLQIVYEDDGDLFKEKLYLYFDELSDLLPDKREWDTFLKEKHFIGVHDIDRGALAAGMVYSKSGSVITEDFIFVTPAYQGKGISKLLHYALYEKYAADKVRYIAWIRTDNIKSIGLHRFFKYQRQEQFKITFRS